MSFTSLQFLLFLPAVFILYWALHRSQRWQNLLLVVASYVFYGWWDWRFLGLIALTTAASFASGLVIEHFEGREGRRRLVAAANIVLNLGILALFKYYDFFADNFTALLSLLGFQADLPTLRLILPVGISFYTFQALSYTIDVFRRHISATRDIVAFFAYIAFFPQLVAGPIERATQLLPQMLRARTFIYADAIDGLRQMLWGFCKKMLVADTCAMAVDIIWQSPGEQSALALVVGAFLFTIQIYGDFSGYSDIAVGCARLFGIRLMQNFRTPYFATSLADFWRRWHISLMTWLRDYVYISLGGNRCSRPRQYANILIVFLLSGLWHGAAWTFVLWGFYHGLLVSVEKATKRNPHFSFFISSFFIFLLVAFGWILFRAPDLTAFSDYVGGLTHLSSLTDVSSLTMGKQALLWSAALLLIEWLQRHRTHALDFPSCGLLRLRAVRWIIYYVLIALLLFCHADEQAFIYFQF
jgi:D-alanyl-lipoteichoic acid acyltransferase DltB (MBOAT superfamily)